MGQDDAPQSSRYPGLPPGTEILRNPSPDTMDEEVGFPDESELIERHSRHFHLLGGSERMAIEVIHFVERRKGFFKRLELVEDKTACVLPEGTDLMEARRIGYRLLEKGRFQPEALPD